MKISVYKLKFLYFMLFIFRKTDKLKVHFDDYLLKDDFCQFSIKNYVVDACYNADVDVIFTEVILISTFLWRNIQYELRSEKTGLRGFRPGPTQTGLYSQRRWLEARDFEFR